MLFFTTLLISLATDLYAADRISLTFQTYPPNPKFGESVTFTAVVQPPVGSAHWSSSSLLEQKEQLRGGTFLWYSKSFFADEFSLIGSGDNLLVKVDSYFNAIYNLTLLIDGGLVASDYSRLVAVQNQFGIEISVNNQSFRSDSHRVYRIYDDKFDFRCRILGDPHFFSLISPAGTTCEREYIEEVSQIHATDFVFEDCGIIPMEFYGCQIRNGSMIYAKTFQIIGVHSE